MAIFDSKAKIINGYQRSIDEKNSAIIRYYDEIGRQYYSQYTDLNVDNTKDINTRCEAITRLREEIETLNHKILYEKGLKLCLNCRTENNLEYTFCYKCGKRFSDENAEAEAPVAEPAAVEAETSSEPVAEPAPSADEAIAPAEPAAASDEAAE